MFRILLFLLFAVLAMIISIPFALITALTAGHDPSKPTHPIPQWIASHPVKWALSIAGVTIDRRGEENLLQTPALYVGNHQGLADIFIAISYLGSLKTIMAKKEAEKIPLIHFWMTSFDCIFLDRSNPREGVKALARAEELLKGGRSVVIFPEGTRSRGPEMGEFKAGAFKCAVRAGVPIVPFAIDDSYQRWDAEHKLHPGTVKLAILPAVSTESKKTQELADEIKSVIQIQLDEFRKEQI